MAFQSYSDLQIALGNWLDRSTGGILSARHAPEFIELYEAKVRREYRTIEMERTATIAASTNPSPLPADWVEMRTVFFVGTDAIRRFLNYRREGLDPTATGAPLYWGMVDDTIMLYPYQSCTLQLEYWGFLSLSATNPLNWLLKRHPDLYLFGALIEAQGYVNDQAAVKMWMDRYDRALRLLPDGNWRRNSVAMPVDAPVNAQG